MPKAVSLAEKLLNEFKTKIEELAFQPSGDGRFEVSLNSELIHSKAETGRFPKVGEIREALEGKA